MPENTWSSEKFEQMLGDSHKVELRVSKVFDNLKKPFSVLCLIEPKEYLSVKNGVLMNADKEKQSVIYITLNSGYKKILIDLESEKINIDEIHFIDMISSHSGVEATQKRDVSFLESPNDLSDCMLVLEKKLSSIKQKEILLIVDSVSAMLVYNDSSSIQKFVHAILAKTNSVKNASTILLSSDYSEKEDITRTISQFVDKTIKL